MARKEMTNSQTAETAASTPQTFAVNASPQTGAEQREGNSSGFYCYIGPGMTGVIQHGAIFLGTRADALKAAAAAIKRQPLVKTLIVSGDTLPEARRKVKTPGTALYANFKKIAAGGRQ